MIRLALGALSLLALAGTVSTALAAGEDAGEGGAGHDLFIEKCGGCHLKDGFGTRVLARRVPEGQAELEARAVLPAALTIAVVRRGIGSMPQIREAELSDAELQAIAQYLEQKP